MRTAKKEPVVHACGCCGATIQQAFGGGIFISPDNRLTQYLLCGHCAAERERDPDAVHAYVELRLATAKGQA